MKKIISLILCTFVICLCCSCNNTSNFSYYKYETKSIGDDRYYIYLIFKDNYYIKYSEFCAYGIPTEIYKKSGCSSVVEYIKSEQKSLHRYQNGGGKIVNRQICFKMYDFYDTDIRYPIICYIYGGSASEDTLLAKLDL